MKTKLLFGLWAFLYIVCYGLGHTPEPEADQAVALTVVGCLFFVPGVWLLVDGLRAGNRKLVLTLRWICVGSLVLTVALFLGNLASVTGSQVLGDVLNELLLLFSVPLGCMQFSLLSLFLWACLLFGSFYKTPQKAA
jgi:hypothetical protein